MFKILADNPLLEEFPPELLEKLAAVSEHETYRAGETVYAEGEPGDGVYLIQSGEALVENQISPGEVKVLGVLDAGDLFGELALFDGGPRSSGIRARTDLEVVRIPNQKFFRLLRDNPQDASRILMRVIVELARTLREADWQILAYYEAGRIIGSEHQLPALAEGILGLLGRRIHSAQAGLLAVWNPYNEEFDMAASFGFTPEQLQSLEMPADYPLAQKLQEQLRLPVEEREALCFENKNLGGRPAPCLTAAPAAFRDKFLGFILLVNWEESCAFSKADLNLLMGISSQLGGAVEAAQLRAEEEGRRRLERKRGF